MPDDQEFANALHFLFEGDDRFLLLLDDDVRGEEGPRGLQLISSCLSAMETNGMDVREVGPVTRVAGSERQHAHLAEVEAQIRRLRRATQTHFVMAFHVAGTNAWKLAWSEDTNESEAVDELITFIRCGMIYDW